MTKTKRISQVAITSANEADLLNVGIFGQTAKQQRIKTALMQDLLTGKKRITTLSNDMEVASA